MELRAKLAAGEIHGVNDLITWNLDIRQFAQDVIENCADPELLRVIWRALTAISVLDPTCGSGAFLFAALNILEALYEACLDRMQAFLDEAAGKDGPAALADFRETLDRIAQHPNRRHFILKSIVIGNLYGVDLMEEAVEICKLRLFLKLVAQVERIEDIEPLPDIDFNIRAGNTLVGFATHEEARRAISSQLDFDNALQRIDTEAALAAEDFKTFRREQTAYRMNSAAHRESKQKLRKRLQALALELDRYLAGVYGVDPGKPDKPTPAFKRWQESHQPFHWFVEFYGIMHDGGFNVIVGNPPYIAMSKVRKLYTLRGFDTANSSDIYAVVLERSARLLHRNGGSAMIVPLSLTFSGDFADIRRLLDRDYAANWFSSFGRIPAALFAHDVRVRNTIHIGRKESAARQSHTTVLHRWFDQARPALFQRLAYAPFTREHFKGLIPKVNTPRLSDATADLRNAAFLFLNGKIMLAYWFMVGDDFDLTKWMFADFPIDLAAVASGANRDAIERLAGELEEAMNRNVSFKLNAGKRVGNFNLAKCRDVTDRSDRIFAEALGLGDAWDDIALFYAQVVKTDFSEEGGEEE